MKTKKIILTKLYSAKYKWYRKHVRRAILNMADYRNPETGP